MKVSTVRTGGFSALRRKKALQLWQVTRIERTWFGMFDNLRSIRTSIEIHSECWCWTNNTSEILSCSIFAIGIFRHRYWWHVLIGSSQMFPLENPNKQWRLKKWKFSRVYIYTHTHWPYVGSKNIFFSLLISM